MLNVAIIQARMNSSRLKGKMLYRINDKPLIQWVIDGVKESKLIDKIVLATSTNSENDPLIQIAKDSNIEFFRGSEENVLERFYLAALKNGANIVTRICADNPLINAKEIDRLIEKHIHNKWEYSFNHIPKLENNYPDGLGAEIINFNLLKKLHINIEPSSPHREHVTSFVWNPRSEITTFTLKAPQSIAFPNIKLDIDTINDFHKIEQLVKYMTMKNRDTSISEHICESYLEIFKDQ